MLRTTTVLVSATAMTLLTGGSAAVSATPRLPTTCEVSALSAPNGATGSAVNAGDRSGRYLVGNDYVNGIYPRSALLWDDRELHVLDVPGNYPEATAVNGSGVAVGFSSTETASGDGYVPWVYRDGEASVLPGVEEGLARDVNDRGDIVGDSTARGPWRPMLWPAGSDTVVELPVPPEVSSGLYAAGVAEDGTVVGVTHDASVKRPDRIFAWPPGGTAEPVELQAPGDDLNSYGMVAVRGSKVAAKAYDDRHSNRPERSVIWDLDAPGEPVAVSDEVVQPHAVNEVGWVAGGGPALASVEHGVLRLSGVARGAATAVSADGRTVGGNSRGDSIGQIDAVTWTCR